MDIHLNPSTTEEKTEEQTRISPVTVSHIQKLDAAVSEAMKHAHTPQLKRGRMRHVYRLGVDLKERSDLLVRNLERGDAWLQKHEGHVKYREREDQWLQWIHEYEVIQDALRRAEEVEK